MSKWMFTSPKTSNGAVMPRDGREIEIPVVNVKTCIQEHTLSMKSTTQVTVFEGIEWGF